MNNSSFINYQRQPSNNMNQPSNMSQTSSWQTDRHTAPFNQSAGAQFQYNSLNHVHRTSQQNQNRSHPYARPQSGSIPNNPNYYQNPHHHPSRFGATNQFAHQNLNQQNRNDQSTNPSPSTSSLTSSTSLIDTKFFESIEYPLCTDVFKKYDKIIQIGQGTYGKVFKGKCKKTQNFVALKNFIFDKEKEKEGFPITALREIKILKELEHENIVKLIEICSRKPSSENNFKSDFFMVLEFCEHDLSGLLSSPTVKFSLGEQKNIMQQLFKGLDFIHKSQVLHRDMKAANILVTKEGKLKLADFGLARVVVQSKEPSRYTNRVVSLWYRPPELLLGERSYNKAIDIWGAGCIMAELWTRAAILPGETEQKQLELIQSLCGSITPAVWPDVVKLELYNKINLKKEPQKRRVKERLRNVLKDEGALDLLDKLLELDPKKRIDSDQALNHDFFWTEPLPSELRLEKLNMSMFQSTFRNYGQGDGPNYRPPPKSSFETGQQFDRIY